MVSSAATMVFSILSWPCPRRSEARAMQPTQPRGSPPFADGDVEVVAQIGLSRNDSGGFVLSAALAVTIAGVDQKTAGQLVQGAHAICPYSNAIKGNVDVQIAVSVR